MTGATCVVPVCNQVFSWDEAAGAYDEDHEDGRSYISVVSEVITDSDETCGGRAKNNMGEARMDIINSEIGYLGYQASESYGLTWKVCYKSCARVSIEVSLENQCTRDARNRGHVASVLVQRAANENVCSGGRRVLGDPISQVSFDTLGVLGVLMGQYQNECDELRIYRCTAVKCRRWDGGRMNGTGESDRSLWNANGCNNQFDHIRGVLASGAGVLYRQEQRGSLR